MDNELTGGINNSPVPNQDPNLEPNLANSSERVFDITPDLNISPITNEGSSSPQTPPQKAPVTYPQKDAPKAPPRPSQVIIVNGVPRAIPPLNDAPSQTYTKTPVIETTLTSLPNISTRNSVAAETSYSAAIKKTTPTPNNPVQQTELQKTIDRISPENSILPGKVGEPLPPIIDNPNVKRLRTYESDVAEVMSQKQASIATMAMAERRAKTGTESISNAPEEKSSSNVGKKILITLISIILLGGGAMGAYYLYTQSPLAPIQTDTTPTATYKSIINSDTQSSITTNGLGSTKIIDLINKEMDKPQNPNSIREIVFVEKGDTAVTRTPLNDMLKVMGINIPDILDRSLSQTWMFGVYTGNAGEKSVFVVTTTEFFQNTFAGMLQWERIMADDLKKYLYTDSVHGVANTSIIIATTTPSTPASTSPRSSTTASTTTNPQASTTPNDSVQPYFTIRGRFVDKIIGNRDVREFVTDNGQILFLYSFIDNKRLVITNSVNALDAIISRLEKEAFVR